MKPRERPWSGIRGERGGAKGATAGRRMITFKGPCPGFLVHSEEGMGGSGTIQKARKWVHLSINQPNLLDEIVELSYFRDQRDSCRKEISNNSPSPKPYPLHSSSKQKLLIVDDEEDIRTQMKWALAQDYQVFLAEDRRSALELQGKEQPSVVTLDLGLPPRPADVEEGFATLGGNAFHRPLQSK